MKIGIVGGTFNPIHLGHLMLGEYAYEECQLDEIWFMPNGNPPHKKIESSNLSNDMRLEMTKLAIDGVDYFKIQPYEIYNENVSYSYKTMQEFSEVYKENEFYFIIGSDSLFMLDTWKCPQELLNLCTILVACRENIDIKIVEDKIVELNQEFNGTIMLLQMPLLEISSSDIRRRVALGKSIKYIVPDTIEDYIRKNNLYEGD